MSHVSRKYSRINNCKEFEFTAHWQLEIFSYQKCPKRAYARSKAPNKLIPNPIFTTIRGVFILCMWSGVLCIRGYGRFFHACAFIRCTAMKYFKKKNHFARGQISAEKRHYKLVKYIWRYPLTMRSPKKLCLRSKCRIFLPHHNASMQSQMQVVKLCDLFEQTERPMLASYAFQLFKACKNQKQ